MLRNLLILTSALALAGCINQSRIQGKYTDQQDVCRADVSQYMATRTPDGANDQTAAGTYFSECMNKAGWRVAVPKPSGQVATGPAPNPPSGSPSTNPHAASAVAPPQQAAVAPPTNTSPVIAPPSGAPSTAPSAAAARYLPARPTIVQTAPDYGQGGGRQF